MTEQITIDPSTEAQLSTAALPVLAYGLDTDAQQALMLDWPLDEISDLVWIYNRMAFSQLAERYPSALLVYGVELFGEFCTGQYLPYPDAKGRSFIAISAMAAVDNAGWDEPHSLLWQALAVCSRHVRAMLDLDWAEARAELQAVRHGRH